MRASAQAMIVLTALFAISAPVFAGSHKPPRECIDPDYDSTDCEKAFQLRRWIKDQEKVSDNQRLRMASFGEDVLVEKAAGYRMGLHKMRIKGSQDGVTGVRFGMPGQWKMFVLGDADGCDVSNFVKVLKNTREFIFFEWTCEFTRPRRNRKDINFDYLVYDIRFDRLDAIIQSAPGQKTSPTLTLEKGTYRFRWLGYKQENSGEPNPLFYDFKITGPRPEDIKCFKSWNEECDIALRDGPLKPSEYKIVE